MKNTINGLLEKRKGPKQTAIQQNRVNNTNDGLIEAITFDTVIAGGCYENGGEYVNSRSVQIPTIYNPMNEYMRESCDVDEIVNYNTSSFILYMQSLKNTFRNRAHFLFNNLLLELNAMMRDFCYSVSKEKNNDQFADISVFVPLFNNDMISEKLLDINTYVLIVLSNDSIDSDNKYYELVQMISMEYASLIMDSIIINNLNMKEEDIRLIYSAIRDYICINSTILMDKIEMLCFREPMVTKYIELLMGYNAIHGDIPDELRF